MGRVCCGCSTSTFKSGALTSIRRALNIRQQVCARPASSRPSLSIAPSYRCVPVVAQTEARILVAGFIRLARLDRTVERRGRSSARQVARGHSRERERTRTLRTHGHLIGPWHGWTKLWCAFGRLH